MLAKTKSCRVPLVNEDSDIALLVFGRFDKHGRVLFGLYPHWIGACSLAFLEVRARLVERRTELPRTLDVGGDRRGVDDSLGSDAQQPRDCVLFATLDPDKIPFLPY